MHSCVCASLFIILNNKSEDSPKMLIIAGSNLCHAQTDKNIHTHTEDNR